MEADGSPPSFAFRPVGGPSLLHSSPSWFSRPLPSSPLSSPASFHGSSLAPLPSPDPTPGPTLGSLTSSPGRSVFRIFLPASNNSRHFEAQNQLRTSYKHDVPSSVLLHAAATAGATNSFPNPTVSSKDRRTSASPDASRFFPSSHPSAPSDRSSPLPIGGASFPYGAGAAAAGLSSSSSSSSSSSAAAPLLAAGGRAETSGGTAAVEPLFQLFECSAAKALFGAKLASASTPSYSSSSSSSSSSSTSSSSSAALPPTPPRSSGPIPPPPPSVSTVTSVVTSRLLVLPSSLFLDVSLPSQRGGSEGGKAASRVEGVGGGVETVLELKRAVVDALRYYAEEGEEEEEGDGKGGGREGGGWQGAGTARWFGHVSVKVPRDEGDGAAAAGAALYGEGGELSLHKLGRDGGGGEKERKMEGGGTTATAANDEEGKVKAEGKEDKEKHDAVAASSNISNNSNSAPSSPSGPSSFSSPSSPKATQPYRSPFPSAFGGGALGFGSSRRLLSGDKTQEARRSPERQGGFKAPPLPAAEGGGGGGGTKEESRAATRGTEGEDGGREERCETMYLAATVCMMGYVYEERTVETSYDVVVTPAGASTSSSSSSSSSSPTASLSTSRRTFSTTTISAIPFDTRRLSSPLDLSRVVISKSGDAPIPEESRRSSASTLTSWLTSTPRSSTSLPTTPPFSTYLDSASAPDDVRAVASAVASLGRRLVSTLVGKGPDYTVLQAITDSKVVEQRQEPDEHHRHLHRRRHHEEHDLKKKEIAHSPSHSPSTTSLSPTSGAVAAASKLFKRASAVNRKDRSPAPNRGGSGGSNSGPPLPPPLPHSEEVPDADAIPASPFSALHTHQRNRSARDLHAQSLKPGAGGWSFDSYSDSSDGEGDIFVKSGDKKKVENDEDPEEAVLWLDDEKQSLRVLFPGGDEDATENDEKSDDANTHHGTRRGTRGISHFFRLLPSYLTPPPAIRLRIPLTQGSIDVFQKKYTQYHMFIKQGRLSWRVVKRYSDFVNLHEKLKTQFEAANKSSASAEAASSSASSATATAGGGIGVSSLEDRNAINVGLLPSLPSKRLPGKSSLSPDLIEERRRRLQSFMLALVKMPEAMSNVYVMSFLGVVNAIRDESGGVVVSKSAPVTTATDGGGGGDAESSSKPVPIGPSPNGIPKPPTLMTSDGGTGGGVALELHSSMNRNVIHISQLRGLVKWGDLILFRCQSSASQMQRMATGAEWDHVALVVKRRFSRTLELLESTGDGVGCYPLISRLKAYGSTDFTQYMSIRSLLHTRTYDEYEKMASFIESVIGLPYGFNFQKLFGAITINTKIGIGESSKKKAPEQQLTAAEKLSMSDGGAQRPSSDATRTSSEFSSTRGTDCGPSSDATIKSANLTIPPSKGGAVVSSAKPYLNAQGDPVVPSPFIRPATQRDVGAAGRAAGAGTTDSGMGGTAGLGTLFKAQDSQTYFCSELIAACLKAMGLMYQRRNEMYFWPGEFAKGGAIEKSLIEDCAYGEELIIDCRVLEIGEARYSAEKFS